MNHHTDASINNQSKASFVSFRRHDCFSRGHIGPRRATLVDAFAGSSVLPIMMFLCYRIPRIVLNMGHMHKELCCSNGFFGYSLLTKMNHTTPHHITAQYSYRRCASQYSNIVVLQNQPLMEVTGHRHRV